MGALVEVEEWGGVATTVGGSCGTGIEVVLFSATIVLLGTDVRGWSERMATLTNNRMLAAMLREIQSFR
jgi:hypothetical protein